MSIFTTEIQFKGIASPEPELRDMIIHYYRLGFDQKDAEKMADKYINQLKKVL